MFITAMPKIPKTSPVHPSLGGATGDINAVTACGAGNGNAMGDE